MVLRGVLSRQLRLMVLRGLLHAGRCGMAPIGMPSDPLIDGLGAVPQVQPQYAC